MKTRVKSRFSEVISYQQSRISRTPYPPIGGPHAFTGAQNSVPSLLSSLEKASIPKLQ